MLSARTTSEQIDAWRAAKSETENLEFKEAKNQFDYKTLLGYCVAFANERGGILLLGIANWPPRPVVGTNAFPDAIKTAKAIFDKLGFRVDIEVVQHPEGRVLVFRIPARPVGHPYHLDGAYLMRVGESLVPMTQDQLKQILSEGKFGLREAIITTIVLILLSTVGVVGFKYRNADAKHQQRNDEKGPAETRPIVDKPTGAKPVEHQPNARVKGSVVPKSQNTQATGSVDWHDKHNWREHLRVGMTRQEVRELFGEAEKIRVSTDLETWDYGSGEIEFFDGALYSWSEPDDSH